MLDFGGELGLAGGGGQVGGVLGGGDGFRETAGFGIRGSQRVQRAGMIGAGQRDGAGSGSVHDVLRFALQQGADVLHRDLEQA